MNTRYEIRGARLEDEEPLLELAQFLNTINLPNDRASIRSLLEHAHRSFTGEIGSPADRRFVFVLWDLETNRAVGTSMIVAQHGRREAPYIYLDVIPEEKYSRAVDRHFHHLLLRIGFSYDGPTEIGGLVVHPEYRKVPERLGLLISYVRFLYIAAHRSLFRDELIAELLPPLESDGTSHLWEALGRHFTGMSYAEADFLSSRDKTFIRDLFPGGMIYASVLSEQAQRVIGEVGAQTKGVEKMLRRVGFSYAERVDPFDGGPHFIAETDQVTLVQQTRRLEVGSDSPSRPPASTREWGLVAKNEEGPPFFRARRAQGEVSEEYLLLPTETRDALGLKPGDPVYFLPLGRSST